MMSHEDKAVGIALALLLGVLIGGKLALWPWVLRRRTHRYRGVSR